MMFLTAMGVAAAVQAAGLHRRIALGSVGLLIIFNFKLGGVFYDNDIFQDTHVDWDRQEESACQVWQVLFVSTITIPPSQFYGDHMYDLHVHLQHGHLRHDVPHLEGEVHLVVIESNSSSRWCWSKCTGRT